MGGVFIYFCLKQDANVSVTVSTPAGKVVRTMPAVSSRAGDNQIFFNAIDDAGASLPPGQYVYELKGVTPEGRAMVAKHAFFNKARETQR